MSTEKIQFTIADEIAAREEGGFSALLRRSLEMAPWFVASVMLHVVVFAAMILITTTGAAQMAAVDITATIETTPTPTEAVEDSPEPSYNDPIEDPVETLEPNDIEDPPDEIDDPGDPEAPAEQPTETIGAIGLGAGHYDGAYGRDRGRLGGTPGRRGATPQSEISVDTGLKWLADHQETDGHWDTKKWGGSELYDPGICGLALLAFAGAGHTERNGKYHRVVQKATQWLAEHQDANGNFAPTQTMYSHAIPTLALLELSAMAPVPRTQAIAKKGFNYMISAQNQYKAWRYWPKDNDNDVSVTTWCVMAMKAAKIAGMDVPAGSWAGVKNFLDEVTEPNYGEVGYTARPIRGSAETPYQRFSMTACGMLCRLYMGVSRDDRLIKNGTQILLENLPEWDQPGIGTQFYYYWYYGSLVMFQIEGEAWKKWNTKMRDMLVLHQNKTVGELYGSWDPTAQTHFCRSGGRVYSTAMAVLTLETYYRYEIISGKDGGK